MHNLKLWNFKLPKNTQKKIILNLGCEGISKCSKIVLDTKILNFWATKIQFGFYPKHEKMAVCCFAPSLYWVGNDQLPTVPSTLTNLCFPSSLGASVPRYISHASFAPLQLIINRPLPSPTYFCHT